VGVHYKYQNVGFADEATAHDLDAARNGITNFSLGNKTRGVQAQASQLKIQNLRQHYGKLIGTESSKEADACNPFQGQSQAALNLAGSAMSLSVYNKPRILARPKTANVNILANIKGLEPAEGEEAAASEAPAADPRIADFDIPDHMTMLARTGVEQRRLEQMVECEKIM
jgi:hypothetical protein